MASNQHPGIESTHPRGRPGERESSGNEGVPETEFIPDGERSGGIRDSRGAGGGFGPFLTIVDHRRPDGVLAHGESRRHRKHLDAASSAGSTWWAPTARGWWIAVLFAVGSVLFALGALPGYVGAVGGRWGSATFFVGSLFFTSAGFLTYREALDAAR